MIISKTIKINGLNFAIDECGEGENIALLLHGFPEARQTWHKQMPIIAKQGWKVIAPDLRGYGDSDKPKGKKHYHINKLIEDVDAIFNHYKSKKRLLIGHDWGGCIAWAFALSNQTKLDGLLIINMPHPFIRIQVLKTSKEQQIKSKYISNFKLPIISEMRLTKDNAKAIENIFASMLVDKAKLDYGLINIYKNNALKKGAINAMLNYYRQVQSYRDFCKINHKVIETATLMIWGEEDKAFVIEHTYNNKELFNDFTLKKLPNISHFVQMEASELLNEALIDWLENKNL